MSNRTYWTFTLTFWVMITVLLFVNALTIEHIWKVAYRFFFLPVLGVLICAVQTLVYQGEGFRKLRYPQPWVLLFAVASAFLIALTLNLITFLLLDIDVESRQAELFHHGAPIYTLIFIFWAFIWFQLDGRPLLGPKPGNNRSSIDTLTVDHLGRTTQIKVKDVEFFAAAGDYVEIQLPQQSYLKKGTISALEELLDQGMFRRIHRSTIINCTRVRDISPKRSGIFEITFPSGHKVNSSRSYRSVVQQLQAG